MKARIIHITVTAVLVMGIAGQYGFARGLLGERYIGFEVGQTNPGDGDLSDIDNSIFGVGGGLNVPITPNVDAGFGVTYTKISGNDMGVDFEGTGKSYIGGINYHFKPNQKVNPFVGLHAGIVSMDAKASNIFGIGVTDHDDDVVITISGGLEVDLSEPLAIRPSIAYQRTGDFDDVSTGIGLSLWFNEFLFGTLSASYAFDEGDLSYFAGLGFGF
jgi:opacity protein-like surface antigen